jgi:hypothetical protein
MELSPSWEAANCAATQELPSILWNPFITMFTRVVHWSLSWARSIQSISSYLSKIHGMARPQVADGGDGLQVWRVAENILNKQSQTVDTGSSSSLGVGRGTNNSSTYKNKLVAKDHKKPRTWTYSLYKWPKRKKIDMRFATWNVRSMFAGSLGVML